jgi:hypothetical protein
MGPAAPEPVTQEEADHILHRIENLFREFYGRNDIDWLIVWKVKPTLKKMTSSIKHPDPAERRTISLLMALDAVATIYYKDPVLRVSGKPTEATQ